MALVVEQVEADKRKKSRSERGPRRRNQRVNGRKKREFRLRADALAFEANAACAASQPEDSRPSYPWPSQHDQGDNVWASFGNLLLVEEDDHSPKKKSGAESYRPESPSLPRTSRASCESRRIELTRAAESARTRAEVFTGSWSEWAILVAEAERCRRVGELARLAEEEALERMRRREWAASAIATEQRRRAAPHFLSATTNTRWYEEMVGTSVWDADYEISCPFARQGCDVACTRSQLQMHLNVCPFKNNAEEVLPKKYSSSRYLLTKYVVVCPNAVMGCTAVCPIEEIQKHLEACPFSDCRREREYAQREHWRQVVADQAEQERDRRVEADSRATLAAAAARAARGMFRLTSDDVASNNISSSRSQAALMKGQRTTASTALGAELRQLAERHQAARKPLAKLRRTALEAARAAITQAFTAFNANSISVELFGSCAYGLETPASDLDIVVRGWASRPAPRNNATWVIHRLAQQLKKTPIRVDRVLDRARVPIIRGVVLVGDDEMKIDLSLETSTHTGLAAAGLINQLLTQLPSLAPAAVALKSLLRAHSLDDPYRGGLPSYALILMLLYSRLRSKKVRHKSNFDEPPLLLPFKKKTVATAMREMTTTKKKRPFEKSSTLEDRSWRDANATDILKQQHHRSRVDEEKDDDPWTRGSLIASELISGLAQDQYSDLDMGETLIDFLNMFRCDEFSPQREGISVRHGGRRYVLDSGLRTLVIAPNLSHVAKSTTNLNIEDPLDSTNNVGRSSYDVQRALKLFAERHDNLQAAMRFLSSSHVGGKKAPLLLSAFLS